LKIYRFKSLNKWPPPSNQSTPKGELENSLWLRFLSQIKSKITAVECSGGKNNILHLFWVFNFPFKKYNGQILWMDNRY